MQIDVTIAIKSLNEEKNISRAIESALRSIDGMNAEIVLADSGSSDRTIEIASKFPIKIVQLANYADRSCGAGAQLAFQMSEGKYFYLMDADMELHPSFLTQAIDYLDSNPTVGGVGGQMVEKNSENAQYVILNERLSQHPDWQSGAVERLDGGGLYRSDAIRAVGYFADRNLHAFEESELAARLRTAGWGLTRLPIPAVNHYGHTVNDYRLLWRRLTSGYAWGAGEILTAALGKPHLPTVLASPHIKWSMAVIAYFLTVIVYIVSLHNERFFLAGLTGLVLLPILYFSAKRRSFRLGIYSLASWMVTATGFLIGLVRPRIDPTVPLDAKVITQQGVSKVPDRAEE